MGAGAAALGLAGQVEADQINLVLDGRIPAGDAAGLDLLSQRQPAQLPGYDLTFCAPKSVSLLFCVGGEEVRGKVSLAHDRAVERTIELLERDACGVRRGHAGSELQAGRGFVAATYWHRTARSGDPHLHTHVLVSNMSQGDDGRWSALDGRQLYAWSKAAGALYQAELRSQLTAELGVSWTVDRNGTGEIAGVPKQILVAFSKRKAALDAAAAEAVQTSTAGRETAQRQTRQAKDRELAAAGEDVFAGRVTAELEGMALSEGQGRRRRVRPARVEDVTAVVGSHRGRHDPEGDLERICEQLVKDTNGDRKAEEKISTEFPAAWRVRQASTFLRRDLMFALAGSAIDGAAISQVDVTADRFLESPKVRRLTTSTAADRSAGLATGEVIRTKRGKIVPAGPGEERYATLEMLTLEGSIVVAAEQGLGGGAAGVPSRVVDAAVRAVGFQLDVDQDAMVRHICSSGNVIDVVIGRAGTGKTTALGASRRAWESSGFEVIGCATARKAARRLEEGAGIRSTSVAQLLSRIDKGEIEIDHKTVVALDEAGMTGSRDVAQLVDEVVAGGGKLVMVGDPKQLPPIDSGGIMRSLSERLAGRAVSELTINHRQKTDWEKAAAE